MLKGSERQVTKVESLDDYSAQRSDFKCQLKGSGQRDLRCSLERWQHRISVMAVGNTQGTPGRTGMGSCSEVALTVATCRHSLTGQSQSIAFPSPRAISESRRLMMQGLRPAFTRDAESQFLLSNCSGNIGERDPTWPPCSGHLNHSFSCATCYLQQ